MTELEKYMTLNYSITVHRDEEDADGGWIVSIPDLEGCVADGISVEEAMRRLDGVKELWIQNRMEANLPVPLPSRSEDLPSGKWLQRVPRRLHGQIAKWAHEEGVSLNQLVTSLLSEAVGRRQIGFDWRVPKTGVEPEQKWASCLKASATGKWLVHVVVPRGVDEHIYSLMRIHASGYHKERSGRKSYDEKEDYKFADC